MRGLRNLSLIIIIVICAMYLIPIIKVLDFDTQEIVYSVGCPDCNAFAIHDREHLSSEYTKWFVDKDIICEGCGKIIPFNSLTWRISKVSEKIENLSTNVPFFHPFVLMASIIIFVFSNCRAKKQYFKSSVPYILVTAVSSVIDIFVLLLLSCSFGGPGIIFIAVLLIAIIIGLIVYHNSWVMEYPYKVIEIDISGRRLPDRNDILDEYIIRTKLLDIHNHQNQIEKWKKEWEEKIENSHFFKESHRKKLAATIDDSNAYKFVCYRNKTKYYQKNCQRYSHTDTVEDMTFTKSYKGLINRYKELSEINFETTLNKYNAKNQRALMTDALKQQVKERDHYTCQCCGKVMRDGVGLQIDHIIPVSKGGKTVLSNLQVLCSRCNGSKSNKM